jgi:hypothetical protein
MMNAAPTETLVPLKALSAAGLENIAEMSVVPATSEAPAVPMELALCPRMAKPAANAL